jgi:hypothetical protein
MKIRHDDDNDGDDDATVPLTVFVNRGCCCAFNGAIATATSLESK